MLTARNKQTGMAQSAETLYRTAVHQGRQTHFYVEMGVPDTLDGRFEMIALHVFLILRRLKAEGDKQAAALSQTIFDAMFKDVEASLREMGIGDLSVPKHMKRMMNGFNGRIQAYSTALDQVRQEETPQTVQALRAVAVRNLYGTVDTPDENMVSKMTRYILDAEAMLMDFSLAEILGGRIGYPRE